MNIKIKIDKTISIKYNNIIKSMNKRSNNNNFYRELVNGEN